MKLKQLLLTFGVLWFGFLSGTKAQDHTGAFITTWDTGKMNSGSLTIPSEGTNYQYYWEKVGEESIVNSGSYQTVSSGDLSLPVITAGNGLYKVYIKGDYKRVYMGQDSNSALALTAVNSWGNIGWTSMESAFQDCENLIFLPAAAPDLSNVSSTSQMFYRAKAFNQNIGNWDVSNVTDMSGMFAEASTFNGDVSGWDVSNVTMMFGMFSKAKLFNQSLINWNVSNVVNMTQMFLEASAFNQDINGWDVSNVTAMSSMFESAKAFNQDINNWNVSKVTNMSFMFAAADNFNGDISSWDVSSVTNLNGMFMNAAGFNGDISKWDVGKVENTSFMFYWAGAFNQDISKWKVTQVTDMKAMFYTASAFNQNLGEWEFGSGVNLEMTFDDSGLDSSNFGLMLKSWAQNPNTPSGISMDARGLKYAAEAQQYRDILINDKGWIFADEGAAEPVLDHTGAFITTWDTDKMDIGTTLYIPSEGTNYEYYWEKVGEEATINSTSYQVNSDALWLTSLAAKTGIYKVYIKGGYERISMGSGANSDIYSTRKALIAVDSWGDIAWKSMYAAFYDCLNLSTLPVSEPNLHNVSAMGYMFFGASAFNGDIGEWDVSNVTNMSYMFSGASAFDRDLKKWNVSNVTGMNNMFERASVFNGDISTWNVSNVTNMNNMFSGTSSFNGDVSKWDVSKVTSMSFMFSSASSFNGDLSEWDVSKVNSMSSMFSGASSFNGDLSKWDVSKVTSMSSMFSGANSFNGDLSKWNVSNVTDMTRMFQQAIHFNGDISLWDVSKVANMRLMFSGATAFNQKISNWNVENVTLMNGMFNGASIFDQNLGNWKLNASVALSQMLNNSGLSTESYGLTLKGWAENANIPSDRTLGALGLKYGAEAQQYRDLLVNEKNWTIDDGGVLPVSLVSFTAKIAQSEVKLNWITASESNNSHFIVEISRDGIHFEQLLVEMAKGAGTYQVYDRFPVQGNNYYRLTQFDHDGAATRLGTQVVNFSSVRLSEISLYPNPIIGNLQATLCFPKGLYYEAVILAVNGQVSSVVKISPGQEYVELATANLPSGIYFIRLVGLLTTTSQKFVKK